MTWCALQEGAIEALLLEHQQQHARALFLSAHMINHNPLRQVAVPPLGFCRQRADCWRLLLKSGKCVDWRVATLRSC